MPKGAPWERLQANEKQPTIGRLIDDSMVAIEKENPKVKGVLAKDYARPSLDKTRLGELIDIVGNIGTDARCTRRRESHSAPLRDTAGVDSFFTNDVSGRWWDRVRKRCERGGSGRGEAV